MPHRLRPVLQANIAFGVTSRTAVDATIALAHRHRRQLMLIASRAQVDRRSIGGGYVEGWTAEQLVGYVRERDRDHAVTICRDHGGPWQHAAEVAGDLPEAEAMASSMISFQEDISAGMELLHLDTSRDRCGPAAPGTALQRLIELYSQCHEFAQSSGRSTRFEIGLEEQSSDVGDPLEFRAFVLDVVDCLAAASLPPPTFVVGQTGTKVVETGNQGSVCSGAEETQSLIRRLAEACHDAGTRLKAHNVDYLGDRALRALVDGGVDAINVAPELGVAETRAFLALLTELGLNGLREEFLELAYAHGAWRKWLAPESVASDLHRCIVAGHYVFGTARFKAIKAAAQRRAAARGIDVDLVLFRAVEAAMTRYLRAVTTNTKGCEFVGQS